MTRKQSSSFSSSKTTLIVSALFLAFFILSCSKDLSRNKRIRANGKAYFKKNPTVVPNINFIIEYRDSIDSTNGIIITRSGEIVEYKFIHPISNILSPGTYEEIIEYFDDAYLSDMYQTSNSSILKADSISLTMMEDYSAITDSITYCYSVPSNHRCNLYQIQHAETNESCYPIRILEGKYENNWYVPTAQPAEILSLLNSTLSESGGLDLIYWEHYGF
ncbi:MAG: hypothetical protein CMP61_08505 [Flavobacteriales bacterium]|nr:hypothetical protein [Flavobacteriales bacterium]|tara:strand:+ start:17704 stop:18360 length:657 start_codon:yes stop_codon:yes gene_type:complete